SLVKLKVGTAVVLCAALVAALVGGSFTSLGFAQDVKSKPQAGKATVRPEKTESDAEFIRRISKDLRGIDPTPAEVHFFVASKDAGKRQKLIDLFIQERQAKKEAALTYRSERMALVSWVKVRTVLSLAAQEPVGLAALQQEFYKELHAAAGKGDVARVTQA